MIMLCIIALLSLEICSPSTTRDTRLTTVKVIVNLDSALFRCFSLLEVVDKRVIFSKLIIDVWWYHLFIAGVNSKSRRSFY